MGANTNTCLKRNEWELETWWAKERPIIEADGCRGVLISRREVLFIVLPTVCRLFFLFFNLIYCAVYCRLVCCRFRRFRCRFRHFHCRAVEEHLDWNEPGKNQANDVVFEFETIVIQESVLDNPSSVSNRFRLLSPGPVSSAGFITSFFFCAVRAFRLACCMSRRRPASSKCFACWSG